jgi:plastocyanin
MKPRTTGLGAVAVATVLLAGACGSSSSRPTAATASTGIQPGSGQTLAGAPGATGAGVGTGSASAGASSMPGVTMTMAPTSGAAAPAAPVGGNTVAISGFAFSPAALTVKAGTTVTWTNKDADAHTVTSQGSGGSLRSKAMATGETFSYTFTTAGTFSYLCTIHPFMTATVTVTP